MSSFLLRGDQRSLCQRHRQRLSLLLGGHQREWDAVGPTLEVKGAVQGHPKQNREDDNQSAHLPQFQSHHPIPVVEKYVRHQRNDSHPRCKYSGGPIPLSTAHEEAAEWAGGIFALSERDALETESPSFLHCASRGQPADYVHPRIDESLVGPNPRGYSSSRSVPVCETGPRECDVPEYHGLIRRGSSDVQFESV